MKRYLSFILIGAAIMTLGACVNPSYTTKNTTVRGINGTYGVINVSGEKTFETKGLIFVTLQMEDSFPNNSDYDKSIVADELLKKAHALGADDIVNIRIYRKDIRIKEEQGGNISDRFKGKDPREYEKHTYEYHASAMAIKYTGTVMNDIAGNYIVLDNGKIIGRDFSDLQEEPGETYKVQPVKSGTAASAVFKSRRSARKAATQSAE